MEGGLAEFRLKTSLDVGALLLEAADGRSLGIEIPQPVEDTGDAAGHLPAEPGSIK